jgi:hypothetical protein
MQADVSVLDFRTLAASANLIRGTANINIPVANADLDFVPVSSST